MTYSESDLKRRFAWGTCGGAITGLQNFLKDSLTLFKAANATGEHLPWILPFFIFMAALTAFVGLLILTACMKKYDATYSAATFVGSFVVSASIMSAIHYHTFEGLVHVIDYILYPSGLAILMAGVFILVRDTEEVESLPTEELIVDGSDQNDLDNQVQVSFRSMGGVGCATDLSQSSPHMTAK